MFLGAMIMGPLTAYVMKHIDSLWDGKIKPGFEMLVDNFSAGILGGIMAIGGMFLLAPPVLTVIDWLGIGRRLARRATRLLPLTSLFIEPAKVLFLNNAINHGVLTPLGIQEATENGKSVLFLLEANPAAGLGLLLAYTHLRHRHGQGDRPRRGDHPLLRRHPRGLLPVRPDEAPPDPGHDRRRHDRRSSSTCSSTPACVRRRLPGSIFAVYAQTPGDSIVGVTLSVIGGAAVTFLVASVLLKMDKKDYEGGDLLAAMGAMESMKGKKSVASSARGSGVRRAAAARSRTSCSPATRAWAPRPWAPRCCARRSTTPGFPEVTVVNKAIANLDRHLRPGRDAPGPDGRAPGSGRRSAVHVSVDNFMGSPRYDEIVELVRQANGGAAAAAPVAGAAAGSEWARRAASRWRHRARRHGVDPRRGDHRGGPAPGRERRRGAGVRRGDARAREVGVHLHGQHPRDPARDQRGEVA